MKRFIAQSQSKSGSFHKEGSNWQDIRNSALGYYDIKYLYYKENRVDDFLIDAMLRLVGSINLSLSPNATTALTIKSKELKTINTGYQMNFDFVPQTIRV